MSTEVFEVSKLGGVVREVSFICLEERACLYGASKYQSQLDCVWNNATYKYPQYREAINSIRDAFDNYRDVKKADKDRVYNAIREIGIKEVVDNTAQDLLFIALIQRGIVNKCGRKPNFAEDLKAVFLDMGISTDEPELLSKIRLETVVASILLGNLKLKGSQ